MKYQLVIRSYHDDKYRHVIATRDHEFGVFDRIEDGANINLNHESYFTAIEEVDD